VSVGLGNDFWTGYQPGFRFSDHPPGSPEFFREVTEHRYRAEPHIPEIARFERWSGRDVLEVGCGIATDGSRFARAGARYVGVDRSPTALDLARRRFDLEDLSSDFLAAPATELPFEDEAFDLVYSHGVIHHIESTQAAVHEFHRVLRPGGTGLVMVYHRDSLNYRVNIMVLRRLLALGLAVPGAAGAMARLTGEDPAVLEGHRRLLRRHGLRYLTDGQLFLSNNTDGPGNPLSKVYSRADAVRLFDEFGEVSTRVRFLNLRLIPGGDRLAPTAPARRLERRWGWHLYVEARK
jgi:SAM-dependent methyltransferase